MVIGINILNSRNDLIHLTKTKKKMKNFKTSEVLILMITIVLIFVSEYYYLVQDNVQKAIFIGLWPPTILAMMIYLTLKSKK